MADIWPTIHGERKALAADLETLSEEQWQTASLCAGWSVRDVLAHLTATAKISTGSFLPKLVKSGFSFNRMQAKDIAVERGSSGADALARFKAVGTSTKHPPGPADTWLGELMVHGEDIRRPLGMSHTYPTDMATAVAQFYTGSNLLIGAKKRIAGVALRATDVSWSHGSGPEVAGPINAIVSAMTGRKAALADLSGEGVAILSSRG